MGKYKVFYSTILNMTLKKKNETVDHKKKNKNLHQEVATDIKLSFISVPKF